MKKLLVVMIMVVCILFIAIASWASWWGTVTYPDGSHAPKYTPVTAIGVDTTDVTDSYTGRGYTLGEAEGMAPGKTYWIVESKVGKHYGFVPGGVYQNSPWVEKNIVLDDNLANPH